MMRLLKAVAMLFLAMVLFSPLSLRGNELQDNNGDTTVVYVYNIFVEIARPAWRTTLEAFSEAASLGADYILLHINTYGGVVDIAGFSMLQHSTTPSPTPGFYLPSESCRHTKRMLEQFSNSTIQQSKSMSNKISSVEVFLRIFLTKMLPSHSNIVILKVDNH